MQQFFSLVTATKIYQFKVKDSEIKSYPLCLENVLKYFSVNNMIKIWLNCYMNNFSVDYNTLDNSNIMNIFKYLMIYGIKWCLCLLKKCLSYC